MKQIFKKVSSICAALLCAATVTAAGSVVVMADEIDATIEASVVAMVESLTNEIVVMTDEEIAAVKESGAEFGVAAMDTWLATREELGTFVALGETSVTLDHDVYTATIQADFEAMDASFVYTIDATGMPTNMSINVEYPMSTLIKQAGLNTVMGIGIVFCMLLFLAFLISLFKFIPKIEELFKGKKSAAPAPAPAAPAPVAAPVVETVADDTELIAVIAAAIAAAEGTSTDGFVVRSIRKVNRKRW